MSDKSLLSNYFTSINRKEDPFNNCVESIINIDELKKMNYVEIKNSDLKSGTYCIRKPGYYKLVENIVFSPFTEKQIKNIRGLHKIPENIQKYSNPAYRLGFFAAFTIETKDVVFDLNGKTISQGDIHHKLQRFYAHIELANAPFIRDQGPAKFGGLNGVAENVLIMNGLFGLSSHHGVHGNNNHNIFFRNLSFFDFEVGAIALNGATNTYIKDCHVLHILKNLTVNHKLSQVLFIIQHLEMIMKRDPTLTISVNGRDHTAEKLIQDIENEVNELLHNPKYDGMLRNHSLLSDGNCYGIILNSKGVAVNEFKDLRDKNTIGNVDIIMEGVEIHDIVSKPNEIIGLNKDEDEEPEDSYTRGQFVGPVGDIFSYDNCLSFNGTYESNILTNAQMFVKKHGMTKQEKGTTNISDKLMEWCESNDLKLPDVMVNNNIYKVSGKDSMGHKMKGNIGLFLSQAKNVLVKDLVVNCVKNFADLNVDSESLNFAQSAGIIVAGSEDVLFENVKIDDIVSTIGDQTNIRLVNNNENIRS